MSAHITDIMQGFAKDVRNLLGSTLDSVIVYGSYARGDYSEFSDIDVMILVSLTDEKIKTIADQISDLAFGYMMKYGVEISPLLLIARLSFIFLYYTVYTEFCILNPVHAFKLFL